MDAPLTSVSEPDAADGAIVREPLETRGEIDFRMIELLFFAYREFTADPDTILERYDFGRAHHRVLHFVNREPGMTIANLLDLLQITKQSLSRVLRQLIDEGFIAQVPGSNDKRQRCLFPTERGRRFTMDLSRAQARRIEEALSQCGPGDADPISLFLLKMAGDQPATRQWLRRKAIDERDGS